MKTRIKIVQSAFMVFLLVAQMSCGNKGSGTHNEGSAYYPYAHGIGGYTLPGGEAILVQAGSQGPDDFPFTISWSISGQAPLIQQLQWTATSPAKVYQGLVNARGTLVIPVNYPAMGCMIPAGTYTIGSSTQGSWSAGIFQFPQLLAQNGATQLRMAMAGVVVDPNGDSRVDRLSGTLRIYQVTNGMVQNCMMNTFSVF